MLLLGIKLHPLFVLLALELWRAVQVLAVFLCSCCASCETGKLIRKSGSGDFLNSGFFHKLRTYYGVVVFAFIVTCMS